MIPIILVIVSIVFYSLSLAQQNKIDSASFVIDGSEKLVNYSGEYKAIVRNIDYDAYYMKIESTSEYLKITTYDEIEAVQKIFGIRIKKNNQAYDSSVVLNVYSDDLIFIDDIDAFLFSVSLDENTIYDFQIFRLDDNSDENNIEVEVFNIPNDVYNLKIFFDSVALTTLLFSVLYFVSRVVMYFIKKKKISYK
ncbi:MAG: hypothetical protein CVV62_00940 [Tenericutes bacterium HGW-Tenericutes-7]|nr:MAG: hypothetical protein CVV62_00940 [Tenericutes bacterium HGW-Tenericutes-7]